MLEPEEASHGVWTGRSVEVEADEHRLDSAQKRRTRGRRYDYYEGPLPRRPGTGSVLRVFDVGVASYMEPQSRKTPKGRDRVKESVDDDLKNEIRMAVKRAIERSTLNPKVTYSYDSQRRDGGAQKIPRTVEEVDVPSPQLSLVSDRDPGDDETTTDVWSDSSSSDTSSDSDSDSRKRSIGANVDRVIKRQHRRKVITKGERVPLRDSIDRSLTDSDVSRRDKLDRLRAALTSLRLRRDERRSYDGEVASNAVDKLDDMTMYVLGSTKLSEVKLSEMRRRCGAAQKALERKNKATKGTGSRANGNKSKTPITKDTVTIKELYEKRDYLKLLDVIRDHNYSDFLSLKPYDCLTKVIDGVEVGFMNVGPESRTPSVKNDSDNLIFFACEGSGVVNTPEKNICVDDGTKFTIPAGTLYNIENSSDAGFKLIVIQAPERDSRGRAAAQ